MGIIRFNTKINIQYNIETLIFSVSSDALLVITNLFNKSDIPHIETVSQICIAFTLYIIVFYFQRLQKFQSFCASEI